MTKQGWLALMTGALFLTSCGEDKKAETVDPLAESRARPVIQNYAALTSANYAEVVRQAHSLQEAIEAFVANPTDATMAAARAAWIEARVSYGQSEAYRFYGGPIDNEDTGPEGQINAWPLDEAYIDGVEENYDAGIINATEEYPELTQELIASLNERDGETNIASGYHAIEFLLWGQDVSETGPGNRPPTDFVSGEETTRTNADRRRQYLSLVTKQLVEDLESVEAQWKPTQGTYGQAFGAESPKAAVLKILTGLGSLSGAELAGERMTVAYDNKDQEDEHSCFSDNTHADLYNNALGIQNVYLGRYGSVSGPGLSSLVAEVNPALDQKMKERLQASLDAIRAIPVPFDQAILGADNSPGRQKVKAAIDALRAQTDTLVEVATALGITLNLE
ncbi:imelysin family protein [Melittangium boletus]|uniref:Iron-regulated protein A n=1 Tax=Melittangium boletus DSM 14713 TaxID=1294270 RepID=A0A250I948_9BACT|nr:imelysin family protein [Melittangium boletus]ATB28389.1 Iron-regulated protein A precursor [Melittangium boletus DSM 14713]